MRPEETDDLIRQLAGSLDGDRRPVLRARMRIAAGALASAPVLIGLVYLLFGWRPDLGSVLFSDAVLLKLVIGAGLAVAGVQFACRLLEPGRGPVSHSGLLALLVTGAGAAALLTTPAADAASPIAASGAATCLAFVVALALPPMALLLWLARRGAATHPSLAGLAIGVTSGALAALAYTFSCPMDASGLAIGTYLIAMALAAGLGALAGGRLLAW